MVADTICCVRMDIRSLITMKDVVECVDRTFQGMGDGTVNQSHQSEPGSWSEGSYPS
jgi:hypothetical protein